MPRNNATGPEGKGPITGRGLGPCNGTDDQLERIQQAPMGRNKKGQGRGQGQGQGRGQGGGGRGRGRRI